MGRETEQTPRERAEKTLLAIKAFKRYLEDVEKDLSHMSKKFSNKEIAQGVGFAATGIHEALTYLAIVKGDRENRAHSRQEECCFWR